jgi:hypothetical protein
MILRTGMKPVLLLLCLMIQTTIQAQPFECTNQVASFHFDQLTSTRSHGNYEIEEAWSRQLSSSETEKMLMELEGEVQYVFILSTDKSARASAIEVRDEYNTVVDFLFRVNEPDNSYVNLFFTPMSDGIYQILYKVIHDHSACTYMAILKGDPDPDFQKKEKKKTD